MSVNNGEPGTCYEAYARARLKDVLFKFAPVDKQKWPNVDDSDSHGVILHPADIGPQLEQLIFSNCEPWRLDNAALIIEYMKSQAAGEFIDRNNPLSNTDRSTLIGCDVVIIPKWAISTRGGDDDKVNFTADDIMCIRQYLIIAEIKLKIGGVVDAAAMGATAHRAWIMAAANVWRNWAVVTDADHLAPMLRDPKARGLTVEEDRFYHTIVIPPPSSVVSLRKTISAATMDIGRVCALVGALKNSTTCDLQLSCEARAVVDFIDAYEERKAAAAAACEASKNLRHMSSISNITKSAQKLERVRKRKLAHSSELDVDAAALANDTAAEVDEE